MKERYEYDYKKMEYNLVFLSVLLFGLGIIMGKYESSALAMLTAIICLYFALNG